MHVSKIDPGPMADIMYAIPEATRYDRCEDLGSQHVMKGVHPILGAFVITDDADRPFGCGYILLSELPFDVLTWDEEAMAA